VRNLSLSLRDASPYARASLLRTVWIGPAKGAGSGSGHRQLPALGTTSKLRSSTADTSTSSPSTTSEVERHSGLTGGLRLALRVRTAGVYGCPGGAPVTVAGESFGGPIALRLAALHPDAVQVLVVINSGSALRRHPLLFYGSYLIPVVPGSLYDASAYCITPFLSDLRRLERENQALMMPPMSVRIVPKVSARGGLLPSASARSRGWASNPETTASSVCCQGPPRLSSALRSEATCMSAATVNTPRADRIPLNCSLVWCGSDDVDCRTRCTTACV
jgi:hypothetical protein